MLCIMRERSPEQKNKDSKDFLNQRWMHIPAVVIFTDLSTTVQYSFFVHLSSSCNLNIHLITFLGGLKTDRRLQLVRILRQSDSLVWPFTLNKMWRETGKIGFAVNCKHSRSLPNHTPCLTGSTYCIYNVLQRWTCGRATHTAKQTLLTCSSLLSGEGWGCPVRVLGFCPTTCLLWLNLSLGGN